MQQVLHTYARTRASGIAATSRAAKPLIKLRSATQQAAKLLNEQAVGDVRVQAAMPLRAASGKTANQAASGNAASGDAAKRESGMHASDNTAI